MREDRGFIYERHLVDRVVAPDGESERKAIWTISESLFATCKPPRLPGAVP